MAQPSTQELLDSGGAYYGYLYYANDTGLWDARNGAMLTKTGTGAVFAEGGVNLIDSTGGAGSTYFTLPAKLTLSGDYTIIWRARWMRGVATAKAARLHTASFEWQYVQSPPIDEANRPIDSKNVSMGMPLSTWMFLRT